ncbi:hypothetical protein BV25DRAFT_1669441 [Artomyces pyxidatus]|uniref:Uncharacterized protein n=1 Tax=Artomyces pyxidatus TaxID=48021 RepID=A0ACB8SIC1_9AGAM|nr:hypothetical protein BV25DRAFT_1669441 [Artomyces pyxidatus]
MAFYGQSFHIRCSNLDHTNISLRRISFVSAAGASEDSQSAADPTQPTPRHPVSCISVKKTDLMDHPSVSVQLVCVVDARRKISHPSLRMLAPSRESGKVGATWASTVWYTFRTRPNR